MPENTRYRRRLARERQRPAARAADRYEVWFGPFHFYPQTGLLLCESQGKVLHMRGKGRRFLAAFACAPYGQVGFSRLCTEVHPEAESTRALLLIGSTCSGVRATLNRLCPGGGMCIQRIGAFGYEL